MTDLQAQLRRLYLSYDPTAAPGSAESAAGLLDGSGRTRALVLELTSPADWDAMARAWQGVQADLQLPAPAIAVNGHDGYQLWFSLAQPVEPSQAWAFLDALRAAYWPDVAASRVRTWPTVGDTAPMPLVPALDARTAQWSAFVARDLAPVFADSPWLDIPPNPDGQADLLAALHSVPAADFTRALALISAQRRARSTDKACSSDVAEQPPRSTPSPAQAAVHRDPRSFLLSVMNDDGVDLALRIEAAKAMLAHGG